MLYDILQLPGIRPYDMRTSTNLITVLAEVIEGEPPLCQSCGKPMHRHGRRKNTFADTPLQMKPVELEILRPRYRCNACGKTFVPELDFIDERRQATARLVDGIRESCLEETFRFKAKQTGLSVNTIKNIAMDLIADLERTVHYETPVIMGIDEVNIAGSYRCVITNLATNNVFDMLEKRTQEHLKHYFEHLPDREKVEWVCTDMWRPFKKSFSAFLPNAHLVIDKFHVVRMASDALDKERKKYQELLSKNDRILVKKTIRWLLLSRPSSLSPAQLRALDEVLRSIPELAEAYNLKEAFYRIYDNPDKDSAMCVFEEWATGLPRIGMEGFHALAKTVRNHYEDIFAYWDFPRRITNAYTENQNGIIKVANRLGRGYSYEIIRAKMLYAKQPRKVGCSVGIKDDYGIPKTIEYGPHIPSLIEVAEKGGLK